MDVAHLATTVQPHGQCPVHLVWRTTSQPARSNSPATETASVAGDGEPEVEAAPSAVGDDDTISATSGRASAPTGAGGSVGPIGSVGSSVRSPAMSVPSMPVVPRASGEGGAGRRGGAGGAGHAVPAAEVG